MRPAGDEIQRLVREWHELMASARPSWADVDLTFMQLRALALLDRQQRLRVSALAKGLGIGIASASALAERMVRRRLVARRSDPTDRRIVLLGLAPAGRRLLDRLERGSADEMAQLIGRMTTAERDALAIAMRAFVRLSADDASRRQTSR